ncbi:hypothetical protein PS850_02270 [Pseudomonas fluorescens]|nr:hypothetical protein PS850_02270 [Pseudomonas fluorescens]
MRHRLPVVLFTLFFSLSGCSQDYSLAPPADSEKVTVTVKLPKELEARSMQVVYRSTRCTFTDHTASGKSYQRDGYQSSNVEPIRQGQSDLYEAKLSMDGGGACKWRLSNVTFGVKYGDPTLFGENVTFGAGGGVTVILDHNNSPRGGADIKVEGNLTIKKDYYPWVDEEFWGPYKKTVSLAGEGDIYLTYQALEARQVYFEPVLHSDYVIYSAGPKVKKKGNYTAFTYPDGTTVADGKWHPNFLRLQTIRTGRDADCFDFWRYSNCPDRRPQLLPDWLPEPDKPGFGRYVVADEWGNKLPSYFYRLVGEDGQVFQDLSEPNGRTKPLPESAHPVRKAEFPKRVW